MPVEGPVGSATPSPLLPPGVNLAAEAVPLASTVTIAVEGPETATTAGPTSAATPTVPAATTTAADKKTEEAPHSSGILASLLELFMSMLGGPDNVDDGQEEEDKMERPSTIQHLRIIAFIPKLENNNESPVSAATPAEVSSKFAQLTKPVTDASAPVTTASATVAAVPALSPVPALSAVPALSPVPTLSPVPALSPVPVLPAVSTVPALPALTPVSVVAAQNPLANLPPALLATVTPQLAQALSKLPTLSPQIPTAPLQVLSAPTPAAIPVVPPPAH